MGHEQNSWSTVQSAGFSLKKQPRLLLFLTSSHGCSVCTHYVAQDKGVRPAKDRGLKTRQREASASFDPPDCSTTPPPPPLPSHPPYPPPPPPKKKRVSHRCSNISIRIKNVANSPGCRCYGPDRKIWFCWLPNISSQTVALWKRQWHSWQRKRRTTFSLGTEACHQPSTCKQNSSAHKHIVSCKTAGLPLTYMRIPKSGESISKSQEKQSNGEC